MSEVRNRSDDVDDDLVFKKNDMVTFQFLSGFFVSHKADEEISRNLEEIKNLTLKKKYIPLLFNINEFNMVAKAITVRPDLTTLWKKNWV